MVSSDKEKFCEAYLGRSNSDYCRWIQSKDAWGGAIEVQILSEYFQVQIVVLDTKSGDREAVQFILWKKTTNTLYIPSLSITGSMTIFGETCNFPTRMVLIYDGIHYDALYDNTDGTEVTVHSVNDERW